jgi:hypothetical protein
MAHREEDLSTLAGRPHWTVSGGRATFAPVEGGWRATVAVLREPAGPEGFHVAIADRTGVTRFGSEVATLADAVRRAEQGVIPRNALRLARPARADLSGRP